MIKEIRKIAANIHQHERGGHDFQHVERVVAFCEKIGNNYPVNKKVLLTGAWLHDIGRTVSEVERKGLGHSQYSAMMAEKILQTMDYTQEEVEHIKEIIISHSYSHGEAPSSLEGRILQDADRLDAIGAMGVARCFLYGANDFIYHREDPRAFSRPLEDKEYVLDHFPQKLFKLIHGFHTPEAKEIGKERHRFMEMFYEKLLEEIEEAYSENQL